jgi:RHS repeat-associated protein
VTDASGNTVGEQRYYAYGETRLTTGTIFTDKLFTGQREMTGLGIYHYNARFYSPKLGRFLSPDTIVQNFANPQFLNRFSYGLNNPSRYTDPSGHTADCAPYDTACKNAKPLSPEYILKKYNVTLGGDWAEEYKWAVVHGVIRTAYRFAKELGNGISGSEAFKSVYGLNDGDTFYFEWDENCWGCREDPTGCDAGTTTGDACVSAFGFTNTENWIEFASMSGVETPLRNINNVIHELGHALNLRLGRTPENVLAVDYAELLRNEVGFYGNPSNRTWEASSGTNGSETFADQFLGWVYGLWDGNDVFGPQRAGFMNQMNGASGWVAQAAGLP